MTKEVFKWLLLIFFYVEICNSLRNSHRPKQTKSIKNERKLKSRQSDHKTLDQQMTHEDILRNTNDITKGLRSYENLIGQLRDNWQMPTTYLEKRGYLVSEKPIAKMDSENQGTDPVKGYSSNTQEYESNKLQNFNDKEAAFVNEGMLQQSRMSRNNNIAKNIKLTIPLSKCKDDPKEVFFASDYKDDDDEDDDKYYLRSKLQKPNTGYNQLGLVKKNPTSYDYPPMPMTSSILSNLDSADRNIKFDDLFNNLTKADIEYVKSFLKCFRENKKQFIVDYLHMNETEQKPAVNGNTTAVNATSTKTTTTTTTPAPSTSAATKSSIFSNPFKSKSKGENATATNSTNLNAAANKTTSTNSSTASSSSSKAASNAATNAANKTMNPCVEEGATKNSTENKPGNSQQNVKVNVDVNASDSGEGAVKCPKCTPIRLNEMSLDLEVAEQNSSDKDKSSNPLAYDGYNYLNNAEDFASHFLASSKKSPGLPFEMRSPYADNFLDQSDGMVYDDDDVPIEEPVAKVSKKRQATFEEQSRHNIAERNIRKSSRVQDYYSDYPGDESELSSNFHEYDFGAYEPSNNKVNLDNQQRNQKQKLKYKRRKKGKRTKNFNGESNDSNNPKLDAPAEDSKRTMPKTETDHGFPELSDIKFRINEVQEEAIEKFIESLNSPPEVFSFDVEKYLKEPENRVVKDVLTANIPQPKAFYEFPKSLRLENEQVPFIPRDKIPETEMPASANFEMERNNDSNPKSKRDILREFIKGVANNYLDVKPPADVCQEMPNEEQLKNGASPVINEEPTEVKNQDLSQLTQNYYIPNNQVMDVPMLVRETKQDEDDFIDKYYLLNDGKSPYYKTTAKEMKALYDPQALSIDMDLNEKFKDLKYGKRDFLAEKRKNIEKERSVPVDVYILSKEDKNAHINIPR